MQAYFWAGESCLFIVEFTRSPSLILSPWKTWESSNSSHWGRGLGEIEVWGEAGGGGGGGKKSNKMTRPTLCYSFAILHGLYVSRNIRPPEENACIVG